ncbi:MAG: hypothetical protein ACRCX8_14330 [Sarcina sp.]
MKKKISIKEVTFETFVVSGIFLSTVALGNGLGLIGVAKALGLSSAITLGTLATGLFGSDREDDDNEYQENQF